MEATSFENEAGNFTSATTMSSWPDTSKGEANINLSHIVTIFKCVFFLIDEL